MTDSVEHYLRVWQMRLSMAERGVTSPPRDVVEDIRQLVASLSAVDPNTVVRLEIHGKEVRFMAAATGTLIGTFILGERPDHVP